MLLCLSDILSFLASEHPKKIDSPDLWTVFVNSLPSGFFTFISAALAAFLAYRFAVKHSKILHNTTIKGDRLRREIDALEKIWGLLIYIAPNENEKSIIRWRNIPNNEKAYFFHYGNLCWYVKAEVSQVIYREYSGLYMPEKIKEPFFSLKNILMEIYIRYENDESINEDSLIPVENPEFVKVINARYQYLNMKIKDELEQRYKRLTY